MLALAAVMNTFALAQNGYANAFYSAGVKSMLGSVHNFLFASADPGGLISIDKPPLAMWLQVASAKAFGFSPLALLLPEAIAGVISVALLYLALARPFGRSAALGGALCLAVFPSFVAISRDNNPDALLILLMILSCWIALRAIESGRLLTLLACAFALGLAFNTKTLASWLVIPGIALAYVLCAPGRPRVRIAKLLAAGLVLAAVSLAWLMFVDLTPASQRPYVGSSKHNSELGLTFGYNGFGRLEGQSGGPGQITVIPGAYVPTPARRTRTPAGVPGTPTAAGRSPRSPAPRAVQPATLPDGRASKPIPFGTAPGPLRLLETGFGGQAGWLLPFALAGLIAMALLLGLSARAQAGEPAAGSQSRRRDRRLAALLVFGCWFAVEAIFLSSAQGIVHPYYTSALAPGAAAMCAAGLAAMPALSQRGRRFTALAIVAIAATVAAQSVMLVRDHYVNWLIPVLIFAVALAAIVLVARPGAARATPVALASALVALAIAPATFAAETWGAPVQGTFPVAGPWGSPGFGGVDARPDHVRSYRRLLAFLAHHRSGSRFSVLTVSSVSSAPLILMGTDAASVAGYSGDDPALGAARLARMVARGEARYVLLGGPYSSRGGNGATRATLSACRQIPGREWGEDHRSLFGYVLFDCAGRERALIRAGEAASA